MQRTVTIEMSSKELENHVNAFLDFSKSRGLGPVETVFILSHLIKFLERDFKINKVEFEPDN